MANTDNTFTVTGQDLPDTAVMFLGDTLCQTQAGSNTSTSFSAVCPATAPTGETTTAPVSETAMVRTDVTQTGGGLLINQVPIRTCPAHLTLLNGACVKSSGLLPLMTDSYGREVSEADFGGGDSDAAGADGTAGDGAPIANAKVTLVDKVGKVVTTTTDAQGYYRVSIKGMTPPFVASVNRSNATAWQSIQQSPAMPRGFITANLTGLTDKIVSDVLLNASANSGNSLAQRAAVAEAVKADGVSAVGSLIARLSPSELEIRLKAAKSKLAAQLSAQLAQLGLDATKFDPVTTPFKAVLTDPYDKLLELVNVTKDPATGSTTVVVKYTVGGSVSGLVGSGLVLANGSQTVSVSPIVCVAAPCNASFVFPTALLTGTAYSVAIKTQPAGQTCTVSNGSGSVAAANVSRVAISCVTNPVAINGVCGTANTVAVLTKPAANLCSSGTAGTVTGSGPWNWSCNGSNGGANASCSAALAATPTYTLGGSISGLTGSGLVLANGGQTVAVAANAVSFVFATKLAAGVSYTVTVQTQPAGQTCTVSNGSLAMPAANVNTAQVTCVTTTTSGKYSKVGNYPITDCVKDTTTGLIWEGKPTSGLRASANTYTNFDSTTALQYTTDYANYVAPTQSQIDAATNSIGFKNAVNASALCGYTDWRLPTVTELQGLVLTGVGSPTIDTTWFPNTQDFYWTSTPVDGYDDSAWLVYFGDGVAFYYYRDDSDYLRLVRSTTSPVAINGVCGTANTVAVLTKPVANLCSSGTAGTVTGSGPWNWSCSGSNGGSSASCSAPLAATPTYTLGGSISGLTGSGLVLANGGQTVAVPASASSFTFATRLTAGSAYNVTVQTQPTGQTCTVSNGSSTMPASNVSSVSVTCVSPTPTGRYSTVGNYPITDCVKDNTTGLIWEGKPTSGFRASGNTYTNYDNTAENQVYVNSSSPYIPPTQSQIDAATNSIGYKNAVNASALCGYTNWRVPTKTELEGLVLTGVGSPTIDTTWFPNTLSNWHWSSTPNPWTSNGAPADLAWYVYFGGGDASVNSRNGHHILLRLVRSTTSPVAINGVCGTANTVAVLTKPVANLCSSGTAGTVTGSGPWNWSCSGSNGGSSASCSAPLAATPTYTLGGSISGLTGSGLVLANAGQTVAVAANAGSFVFATPLAAGVSYTVTVQTQPSGQTCTVTNGSFAMPAANVSTAQVTCVTTTTSGKYSTVGSFLVTDCVKDNTTGLTWEGKPYTGLRANRYYTNYDSTTALQYYSYALGAYVAPTQSQIDAATNSIGYQNAVNASALCGYTDWRLPTLPELQGLVLTGVGSPIDTTWFPNSRSDWYWTSTPYQTAWHAWGIYFGSGNASYISRSGSGGSSFLRLVR